MNFKDHINKIKELQEKNIYSHDLLLADYIESNYGYINEEILNLNFTETDFNNALTIASEYYMDTENVSFDMIASVGITLAKWNFLSEIEQEKLLSEVGFGGDCLSEYLDEYNIQKYAIKIEDIDKPLTDQEKELEDKEEMEWE